MVIGIILSLYFLMLALALAGFFLTAGVDLKGIGNLRRCTCPNCGAKYKDNFIFATERQFRESVKQLAKKYPSNVRVVVPPHWRFNCPQCQKPLVFYARQGTLRSDNQAIEVKE